MILIYSEKESPRLDYIVHELLERRLGLSARICYNKDEFEVQAKPKINYSSISIQGALQIIPHGLLHQTDIQKQDIRVTKNTTWHYCFFSKQNELVPFDVFAASFWLLSRYEEYTADSFDDHRRFSHEYALAFKNGFIRLPLVDRWAQILGSLLKELFPEAVISSPTFKFISTIDIDFAYRYKGIGIEKQAGKLIKSVIQGRFSDILTQLQTLAGARPDPYDTYRYINKIANENRLPLMYFFLMRTGTDYDKNISPYTQEMRSIAKRLSKEFACELHPSYYSTQFEKILHEEKQLLEQYTGKKITRSRQHFLKLSLPQTYEQLSIAGVKEDYSMGFANHCGFRASTAYPFTFFNLHSNRQLPLILYPVTIMDTALRYGMKLTPVQAMYEIETDMNEVEKTGGVFISIWHNSNLSASEGWESWREVFSKMHTLASIKTK
ncbi:MAG: polysaccharide deacetylase family protein [Bacteroidota bacterium]|jgi:hypothetical protein|nr:polysaccharide deacetylase family protein [Sphingobacteriales bacterium]